VRRLAVGALLAAALGAAPASAQEPAVRAAASLSPRTVLFGDTVTAQVDAVVDPARVDARRVRLHGDFAPYQAAGPPVVIVAGTNLRITLRLRCWTSACLAAKRHRLVFPPARLDYRGGSVIVRWPSLERYSRLDPVELAHSDPTQVAPWRGDDAAAGPVSYAVRPGLLRWLLVAAGIVFLAASAVLGLRLVPGWRFSLRRRRSDLSPLERALLVLEAAWERGAADQRKALELLAAELESEGEPPLAGDARELAWSATAPEPVAARTLAERVRDVIGGRSNGHRA
jgi:hypothetical protein